jgi:hypothetical protein
MVACIERFQPGLISRDANGKAGPRRQSARQIGAMTAQAIYSAGWVGERLGKNSLASRTRGRQFSLIARA